MKKELNIRQLADTMKVRPEYQGENHPLYISLERPFRQVFETANSLEAKGLCGPAAEQTEPYPGSDYNHHNWQRELDEISKRCTIPPRTAEPLHSVESEVLERLKMAFENNEPFK